jgi:bleomycin hydrolase
MKKKLRTRDIERFAEAFAAEPRNRLALNAVAHAGIDAATLNRELLNGLDHTFSHSLKMPEVTNQKASGRCWLFAGLNRLRLAAMAKMNLETFEFSQTYMMFWDKLEKANFFLENVIETRDEPLDGRLVMWLLTAPLQDGGQWDMFVNLVHKYGVVPKTVMPETHASSESRTMNALLTAKLREFARDLRQAHAAGASEDSLRELKQGQLLLFYRMLCIHLGTPPSSFSWSWRDKDDVFQRRGPITPQAFYSEYVGLNLDDYVCLINAPTKDKPYKTLFTVQYLGNVIDGQPVRYLNVKSQVLQEIAAQMIAAGEAVWFGCDVGKMLDRVEGILDLDVFDYELVYGSSLQLDKAARLDYGQSCMTHAMMLAGVDLDAENHPRKWRVENSWGPESGHKGYLVMSNAWFDEYLYEITVHKQYLSEELLAVLETEPVVLPPWDPMGSLAAGR